MKKPTWPEVIALAEKHDTKYSVLELQRFTRDGVFPADLVAKFWPKATPRQSSMLRGLTRYHGKPCGTHGTTERFVCCRTCVECQAHASRKKYHKNPEHHKQRATAWRKENREYRNTYDRAWRQKKAEAA